jgi:hypothetical protein
VIPTRSRLARSLSFQLDVHRDDTAVESRKMHAPGVGRPGRPAGHDELTCQPRFHSPIPRGDQDRPLGNRLNRWFRGLFLPLTHLSEVRCKHPGR